MPKVRRTKKRAPDGWELIEPTLEELVQKMREGKFQFLLLYDWQYSSHNTIFFQLKLSRTKVNE